MVSTASGAGLTRAIHFPTAFRRGGANAELTTSARKHQLARWREVIQLRLHASRHKEGATELASTWQRRLFDPIDLKFTRQHPQRRSFRGRPHYNTKLRVK